MFKVQITYKSGKIEIAYIDIADYSEAVTSLINEKRMISMEILEVVNQNTRLKKYSF